MNEMNDKSENNEESLKNSENAIPSESAGSIENAEKSESGAGAESKSEPEKIQKDVLVSELVEKHPELVEPLMMMGMHCISCFASQMETLEEASMVHGLNPDEVVADLNDFLADMQTKAAKKA